ncbi:TerD family protein [Clostridium formicaceticum]|uniref:Stress protein n=1 Tax=Clostridium formicaceticum TaxID=1497 RepID=A0AAC9RMB4_9CLOT|nr:TerD family protein [Clostridium formicaceticum]AOY77652.1 stress protein [Clostridium formicaceticum]ARE88237.1 Stress response protein SCP2 [Clostridium formicaceticum]
MSINLQKGQRVDLTKGNKGLSRIMVGLGWDPVEQPRGGFLSSLFGGGKAPEIDCDASVLMLNEQGRLVSNKNLIYFGNLKSGCGSVKHAGDNLTGGGDGDDEEIFVELNKVPSDIHKLFFVVNIYDCIRRKQDFGMINNAFIRLVNLDNKQELIRYNLTNSYSGKTALMVGEIYRDGAEWKFAAVGEGTNDASLGEIVKRF